MKMQTKKHHSATPSKVISVAVLLIILLVMKAHVNTQAAKAQYTASHTSTQQYEGRYARQ